MNWKTPFIMLLMYGGLPLLCILGTILTILLREPR
jgi:hypothetical protein